MRVLTGQLGTQDRGIGCSTFRACNVLLIISRAIQITPVSTCQTRLSQRQSCCFLPAFRLLKTLLEPREAAVPCKPGSKIAQALLLSQCHPPCAASLRSELLENKCATGEPPGASPSNDIPGRPPTQRSETLQQTRQQRQGPSSGQGHRNGR